MSQWAHDSDKERQQQLDALEDRNLPRAKRHTRYVGLGEAEFNMLRRLADDMKVSQSKVFNIALTGLYYAHFGRRGE